TQLIDTLSGNHIWAERFDRDWGQILVLQDEVRAKIVQSLKVKLSVREEQRLARHPTDNPEAYDLYLRGLQQESYFTREGNEESRRLFSLAIELDPKFAMAYGHLALAYSLAQENSWAEGGDAQVEKTLALARKSVELDADLPQARWSLGRVYARARPPHRDYGRAIEELERAVRLDPNYADGYALLANVLSTVGRPGEALNAIEKAIQINPHHPFWYLHTLGVSQFLLARFEIAEKSFSEASKRNPNVTWMHAWLLSTYGHLGKRENAAWEVSELEGLNQPVTLEKLRDLSFVEDTASLKLFLEGLRKAGVPES
ncbi:MAG: tetratricopeptide repeat protein, partial [Pseudomonadota bacterium]|nr:tetratricopeptide repeat protein [Pseudomonadota bacterium]